MTSKTIGLVTCAKLPELSVGDRLLLPAFRELGYEAKPVIWSDDSVRLSDFDALILRSPWDYHLMPEQFSRWLDRAKEAGVELFNPLEMIQWNMDKRYLGELSAAGLRVVPTEFVDPGVTLDLVSIGKRREWELMVVKPAISATAYQTFLVARGEAHKVDASLRPMRDRTVLVQPFRPEIESSGELSVMFIGGRYRHSVIKRAKANDFRVQSDFGGTASKVSPPDDVIAQAKRFVDYLPSVPVYARVDGLIRDEVFELMELELIEPDLFLQHEPSAPIMLARECVERLSSDTLAHSQCVAD